MLENLLNWSRSQTVKIQCRPENVKIEPLIAENLSLVSMQAEKKGINVSSKIENESLEIFTDRNMLLTVLNNLTTNAVKFTPPGGSITIAVVENGNFVETRIIDTGIGISAEHIDHIFELESQYTTVGTAEERGTGLGLIICKEFVSMNHGNISVKSKPGKGSTFTVALPKKSTSNIVLPTN